MKALMQWLAKHGAGLTEPEKIAAKRYANAHSNNYRIADTRAALKGLDPKQAEDINWLYQPDLDASLKEAMGARKGLAEAFGEKNVSIISDRDQRLQDLLDLLREESDLAIPGAGIQSKYYLKD